MNNNEHKYIWLDFLYFSSPLHTSIGMQAISSHQECCYAFIHYNINCIDFISSQTEKCNRMKLLLMEITLFHTPFVIVCNVSEYVRVCIVHFTICKHYYAHICGNSSVIPKPPDMPSNCHCFCWFAVAVTSAPLVHTHTNAKISDFYTFSHGNCVFYIYEGMSHLMCASVSMSVWNFLSALIVGSPHYVIGRDMCIVTIATVYVQLLFIPFHPFDTSSMLRITLWVHVCEWDVFIMSAWNNFIHAFCEWRNPNIKEVERKGIIFVQRTTFCHFWYSASICLFVESWTISKWRTISRQQTEAL